MNKIKSLLTVIICFSITVNLYAQTHQGHPQHKRMGGEKMMELKQSYFKENFKLSEKESEKFWAAYKDYQEKERAIHQKCKENMEKNGIVREQGKIDFEKLNDEQLLFYYDSKLETERMLLQNREKFHKTLKEILPPKKIAEYYQLEKNFKRELSKASTAKPQDRLQGKKFKEGDVKAMEVEIPVEKK